MAFRDCRIKNDLYGGGGAVRCDGFIFDVTDHTFNGEVVFDNIRQEGGRGCFISTVGAHDLNGVRLQNAFLEDFTLLAEINVTTNINRWFLDDVWVYDYAAAAFKFKFANITDSYIHISAGITPTFGTVSKSIIKYAGLRTPLVGHVDETSLIMTNNGVDLMCRTPDGTKVYRVGVSNAGVLTVTLL
jgi:hypothetical protein